jgi:glycosyltransferase involved in cell wall biosynthesis
MSTNKKKCVKKQIPFVSVCTPTFNRRPFIENMFKCFRNQTYPKNRIEWIIVDDGTDKIRDLVEKSNIPQIRYFEVKEKMTLGAKRNYMHKFVRGTIVVYMDDDDYYPPQRIEDAVEKLEKNPQALCAGSSEIYIYFKHIKKMYKCGPYNANHATAGTFAFKKELLNITCYEEHAAVAEERAFLKEYTIPFVQLDPMKAILVFSHNHNTFDKRKMLDNPHPDYFRECDKTVDMFIQTKDERDIYNFFMKDIDGLLEKYEPGDPKMKPDVLKQIKEIEEKREKMMKEEMEKQRMNGGGGGGGGGIMLQQPGKDPIALSNQDIINLIQQQQQQLKDFEQKNKDNEFIITTLQKQLVEKTKIIRENFNSNNKDSQLNSDIGIDIEFIEKNKKLENIITSQQKQLIEKTKIINEFKKNFEKNTNNDNNNNNNNDDEMQKIIKMLQIQLIEKTKTIREFNNSSSIQNIEEKEKIIIELKEINKNIIEELLEKKNEISKISKELLEKNNEIKRLSNEISKISDNLVYTRIPIQIEENIENKNKLKSEPEICINIEEE